MRTIFKYILVCLAMSNRESRCQKIRGVGGVWGDIGVHGGGVGFGRDWGIGGGRIDTFTKLRTISNSISHCHQGCEIAPHKRCLPTFRFLVCGVPPLFPGTPPRCLLMVRLVVERPTRSSADLVWTMLTSKMERKRTYSGP